MQATIRQNRNDLPWRQCSELSIVAGEQDSLAFLVVETVRDMAVAALPTVHTVPITSELPAAALLGVSPTPSRTPTS
jgi:hypothetical protein